MNKHGVVTPPGRTTSNGVQKSNQSSTRKGSRKDSTSPGQRSPDMNVGEKVTFLRDKSFYTKILILYELYTKNYSKLSPIAEKIGITQQAISDYMIKMKNEGLVRRVDGEYKTTIKGTYLLQTKLLNLKKTIDERIKNMSLVENCIALAKTSIKAGEPVALFMEDGWLVAYTNKKSPSIGFASNDAKIDGYVIVENLKGIIDHTVGKLYFLELPSPFNLKSKNIEVTLLQQKIVDLNIDKIGILDIVAKAACNKIGIKPDFEFGTTDAVIDASVRGLNTGIIGCKESIQEALNSFEDINKKLSEKINFELLSPLDF